MRVPSPAEELPCALGSTFKKKKKREGEAGEKELSEVSKIH